MLKVAANSPVTAGAELLAHWARQDVAKSAAGHDDRLPLLGNECLPEVLPGFDVWDMWQLTHSNGATALFEGQSLWFFLATPKLDDPEHRHDSARIRVISLGDAGWSDHGWALPQELSPGSREWSGCAVLGEPGLVTLYFTAAGRRGCAQTYEQRLFEATAQLTVSGGSFALGPWSVPIESVCADEHWYARADEIEAPATGIKGFRDPCYFCDPKDGEEYLLFTGNAEWSDAPYNGVIGIARREAENWVLQPPIVTAIGVNSELERPHVIVRGEGYYLFWSTHGSRFAQGLNAPTGLYAMFAEHFAGPWKPVNGTGLVAANPDSSPLQAYCWCVTAELDVISFVDYPGVLGHVLPADPAERRRLFGGTAAPWFKLQFQHDQVTILRT